MSVLRHLEDSPSPTFSENIARHEIAESYSSDSSVDDIFEKGPYMVITRRYTDLFSDSPYKHLVKDSGSPAHDWDMYSSQFLGSYTSPQICPRSPPPPAAAEARYLRHREVQTRNSSDQFKSPFERRKMTEGKENNRRKTKSQQCRKLSSESPICSKIFSPKQMSTPFSDLTNRNTSPRRSFDRTCRVKNTSQDHVRFEVHME